MSLKAFHVVFITLSIILCLGIGGWGIFSFLSDSNDIGIVVAVFFVLLGLGLVYYETKFIHKFKNVGYL
jgi:hypothetical protein